MTVRTRFSPSPTGKLHLGSMRTALFCALYAAQHNGVFILRIEDTDAVRSEERYVDGLQTDLLWMGVDWQEGPKKEGNHGPYWQSQRQAIYDKYYDQLEQSEKIYPCFCTDAELNLARKLQLTRGQAPRYNRTCLKLSKEEITKRLAAGEKCAWRFYIKDGEKIEFDDIVKGPQLFQSNDIGDFIVRRADGTPPFLFCNAIDDAEMKISHVLRGEDHVANTPRQILILNALNLKPPLYGHLSLIVGDDGSPLSKRHGSFSVDEMREQGYLPLALINYLGRLGHTCDSQALLSFQEMARHFHLDKLSRSPARFDVNQLLYWQKTAVMSMDTPMLLRWIGESVQNQVPLDQQTLFAETIKANVVFPHDALTWAKICFHENVEVEENERAILQAAGEQYFVEAEQAIDKYGMDFKQVFSEMKNLLKVEGKKLFMPMRIALTGKMNGPELAQIAVILGIKKIKHRLGHVFKLIN